jgi:hypothetical protein
LREVLEAECTVRREISRGAPAIGVDPVPAVTAVMADESRTDAVFMGAVIKIVASAGSGPASGWTAIGLTAAYPQALQHPFSMIPEHPSRVHESAFIAHASFLRLCFPQETDCNPPGSAAGHVLLCRDNASSACDFSGGRAVV